MYIKQYDPKKQIHIDTETDILMHTNMKHEHPLDHHCTKSTVQKREAQTADTELCANMKHKQVTEQCTQKHVDVNTVVTAIHTKVH